MSSIPAQQARPSPPTETVEERFRRLAAAWDRDTVFLSSMSDATSHPAYQEIIGLGPEVVPLLLRDLEDNHTHWFAASYYRRQSGAQVGGGQCPRDDGSLAALGEGQRLPMVNPLEPTFPRLAHRGYHITSSKSKVYNCIAWAAHTMANWWAMLNKTTQNSCTLHVSPTRNGGVLIEWEDKSTQHEVEINPDRSIGFLHLDKATGQIETRKFSAGPLHPGLLQELRHLLAA